ncbi:MAG TPA: hypothetical protein PKK92_08740, partial [Methanothrix sp.]|nr:hypothetical protein [Methanothrix sp.]
RLALPGVAFLRTNSTVSPGARSPFLAARVRPEYAASASGVSVAGTAPARSSCYANTIRAHS